MFKKESKIEVSIYYYTNIETIPKEAIYDIVFVGNVSKDMILKYHKVVYSEKLESNNVPEYLESLFARFNSDTDNPLNMQQDKIKQLSTHTSMCVGDVVKIGDTYYACGIMGFKEIYE